MKISRKELKKKKSLKVQVLEEIARLKKELPNVEKTNLPRIEKILKEKSETDRSLYPFLERLLRMLKSE
tara:strand:- start:449 stop:655 length:207 start_codon:yes stop_codon:yes gene_type:complete